MEGADLERLVRRAFPGLDVPDRARADRALTATQARVLAEIGPEGSPVARVRAHLAIDAGQLSRALRVLEARRLVRVRRDLLDARARHAELTSIGRRTWGALDQAAIAAIRTVLAPWTPQQRDRLAALLAEVDRHAALGPGAIQEIDPASAEARRCLAAYGAELDQRFPEGFDAADLVAPGALRAASGAFLVVREAGWAIACGLARPQGRGTVELKHLWVDPDQRGRGVARRLLGALEDWARHHGAREVCLDTHASLREAVGLYRTSGYHEVSAFGDNPHAHHWFVKELAPVRPARASSRPAT
ncbi:MAG: GNAT family N-acetyltransferase [Acidimicrobiales bacterium]